MCIYTHINIYTYRCIDTDTQKDRDVDIIVELYHGFRPVHSRRSSDRLQTGRCPFTVQVPNSAKSQRTTKAMVHDTPCL